MGAKSTQFKIRSIGVEAVLLCVALQAAPLWAADKEPTTPIAAPGAVSKSDDKERNFYEVLEDVLSDFEYDLKNGEVVGLKDMAIRNIATSENIPPSFKNHLELVVTERILKTTRTRVIQCLPCKARRTTLNGDQVVITSAETNSAELSRIAKQSNIEHFMDVAFSYQPAGIVMSMYISEPETGSIIWSRSYNSETSRASAFRRGVDFSQTDDARKQTEYVPQLQFRITLGYGLMANVSGYTGNLSLGGRLMERYDNRKKEVGFEFFYLVDAASIVNSTAIATTNLYRGFTFNLGMLFMHTWNFIGEEENYNRIRGAFSLGVGGIYALTYLTGLIRASFEWRMAKHFGVTFNLGFLPPAPAYSNSTLSGTVIGIDAGLGISYLF